MTVEKHEIKNVTTTHKESYRVGRGGGEDIFASHMAIKVVRRRPKRLSNMHRRWLKSPQYYNVPRE